MLKIENNHILFKSPSTTDGLELGAVYSKGSGFWRLPFNLGALRELLLRGYDVRKLGLELQTEYLETLKQKEIPFDKENQSQLRTYQKCDVNYLLNMEYAGLFNEQRMGKTPTMCRVIEHINKPTIIICPSSLVLNWRDELNKWTLQRTYAINGNMLKNDRRKKYQEFFERGGVLIMSMGMLRSDIELVQSLKPHVMVVDEAHFLRNRNTVQSKAVFKLATYTKRRYALTGTPASNNLDDIFGIMHYLDSSKWNSYWQFVDRYFNKEKNYFGGYKFKGFSSKMRQREYEEMLNLYSVQRKRKDHMKWLPDKQYQTVKIPLNKKQLAAYEEMKNTFEVESIELDASTVLTQMLRLRQITSAPMMLGLEAGAKEAFVKEWVENNPNEKLLIFSNFSSNLKALQGTLKKSGLIIGEVDQKERHKAVKAFQQGKMNILLCNIEAAGVGLTLDAASTVIFLDRHYVPIMNEQAEDRIVATSAERNLNALVIDLVCENTIDERILEMVKEKKNIIDIANNYRNMLDWLK